ncbi:hypothetical protein COU77_00175 [Candidatus Peregrinibacteria bacterium CG10_big_fil_rev_8_21_14_0_10_49_16]|nr:MAG: hypothetical protein COW95_00715 [Candidatus Peregrinibacteria bacterium CG22_combo_CG10-13_8_21_14_all_49_11]PIR52477.1 MAG: hypothetical protein COU77_00175 [Candidatus Peregrinibacteria bacterium CG10_big_fil_rev_8_21_14_0_10_49_16]
MQQQKAILLCLHGWGGSKESFTELREALKGMDIEILTPDLPGFGDEPEPPRPWNVDDYALWVEQWLAHRPVNQLTDHPLFIAGHSHGGRIAMKLALRKNIPITHLFLCAAAGIRRPKHGRRIAGLTLAKTGKLLFYIPGLRSLQPIGKKCLYKLFRVHDYEHASPLMQKTLIQVSKEDFKPLLSQIHLPTDIFWGEEDSMTPLADGILMHESIKNSQFYKFPHTRHSVHQNRAQEIAEVIRARIGKA